MGNVLMRLLDRVVDATGIDGVYIANVIALLSCIWGARMLEHARKPFKIAFYLILTMTIFLTVVNLYSGLKALLS